LRRLFLKAILLGLFSLLNSHISAQVYILDDGIDGAGIITCTGSFYDSGGASGDYQNNEDYVVTFCTSMAGESINLDMVIDTEPGFDQLFIYDGPTTSSALFPGAPFSGNTSFSVTSTGNCITVAFSSGSIVPASGWEGQITCGNIPPCSEVLSLNGTMNSDCIVCDGAASLDFTGFNIPFEIDLFYEGLLIDNQSSTNNTIDYTDLCVGVYQASLQDADMCVYILDFNIGSTAGPTATLSGGGTACEGETVPLNIDFTGTPSYILTFAVNGNVQPPIEVFGNNFMADVDVSGTYTLISISSSGCAGTVSGTAEVEITPAPTAIFDVFGDFEICLGGSAELPILLTGNPPWILEYGINFGTSTFLNIDTSPYFLYVTEPGFYFLGVIDDQTCSTSANSSINVVYSPIPSAMLTVDIEICSGSSGELPIEVSEVGGFELGYAIDGNTQAPINVTSPGAFIPVTQGGTYTLVSLTQGDCQGNVSGNASVTEVAAPTVFWTSDISFCEGGMGQVQVNTTGQGPWSVDYQINGGPIQNIEVFFGSAMVDVDQAGLLTLINVVDQVCQGTVGPEANASYLPLAQASISADALICPGGNADLIIGFSGSPDFHADLMLNGAFFSSVDESSLNQVINVSQIGTYSLNNVSDSQCPGIASGSATLALYPAPNILVPLNTAICPETSVTLIGSATGGAGGPFSYAWFDGTDTLAGETMELSPLFSDSYDFLVWDACGVAYSTIVPITVYQTPVIALGNEVEELCGRSELSLDTEVPLSIIGQECAWYIGTDTIYGCETLNYTFENEGTYDVGLSIITVNGCEAEVFYPDFITINNKPSADFSFTPSEPNIIENMISFTDLSEGAESYEWFLDSIIFSESVNPVLVLPAQNVAETWQVCQVIRTDLGCTDTLCQQVRLEGELAVFVPDAFTPDGDLVNDFFYPRIIGGSEEEYLFQIFDRFGSLIWETKDINGKWSGSGADNSDYFTRDGVYTWRMEVKRKNSVDKRLFQGMVTIVR